MDYQADRRATGRWLRTDGDLRAACHAAAGEVAAVARAIAPIDEGHYVASIEVVDSPATDRVGAAVRADDAAGAPVEFGNAHTRGRGEHVLSRAAEIAGLDLA